MRKKLEAIIILIFIALAILGFIFIKTSKISENNRLNMSIGDITSDINISKEGIIKVVDNIEFHMPKTSFRVININIPLTIYEENKENTSLININVYCDGKKVDKSVSMADWYMENEKMIYSVWNNSISLQNIPAGLKNIKIEYSYNGASIIEQYNDATVLKLKNNTSWFLNLEYNVTLPKNSNVFEPSNRKIEVSKLNNRYNLGVFEEINGEYIEVKINKGIINKGKEINKNLLEHKFYQLFAVESKEFYVFLGSLIIITAILYVVARSLTKKIKVEGYVRNPEELLDPIIGEAIIDRKIGAKELIMSCIVELIYRKKLKNIGNDAVEIVDLNQISEYERDIVELVFNGKNRVEFNELKRIFLDEDKKAADFYKKFKDIKQKIENKIYSYHIYSRVGERILKTIRIFAFLILIINILFLDQIIFGQFDSHMMIIMLIMIGTFYMLLNPKIPNNNTLNRRKRDRAKASFYVILVILLLILLIIFSFTESIIIMLGIFVVFIIDILIIKRTKLHVFTGRGRIEYIKMAGLKNYIIDYSLMEQRELDSVIIWDEYLAYSVAFGISNKVSRKFNENLMEANIIIQKIDGTLTM